MKGDDIDNHFHLVRLVLEHYRGLLNEIEQNYRLAFKRLENRATLEGNYATIKFGDEIEDARGLASPHIFLRSEILNLHYSTFFYISPIYL